jgi:hypothetical protein
MAIWSVRRVAPSHASAGPMPDPRRNVPVDGLSPDSGSEPELALGWRLFWASILAMTLVVVIPITVGWLLQPIPDPTPAVIHPAILADRVASPKVITDLPKAQAPPLELLQYSSGHVVSIGN